MMRKNRLAFGIAVCCFLLPLTVIGQKPSDGRSTKPAVVYGFDGRVEGVARATAKVLSYVDGVDRKALQLTPDGVAAVRLPAGEILTRGPKKDFSVQLWVRSTMDAKQSTAILSQKAWPDKSLASQKNPGWVLYMSGGTWAWNMGSGKRRITHERDNGQHTPLNDGKWHQLTMTYDSERSQVRLYYDGVNKAIYHVSDSVGFDFSNNNPLVVGWDEPQTNPGSTLADIKQGAANLQHLVDEFNKLGFPELQPVDLESVVVEPRELFRQKVDELKAAKGTDSTAFLESVRTKDLAPVMKARAELMKSPYTVHQVRDFMEVAPLPKIYSLKNGRIVINDGIARMYAESNTLVRPDLAVDNLALWDATLSDEEIIDSYAKHFKPSIPEPAQVTSSVTAAVWNIHHGGIHNTIEVDGFDSRLRIAAMIKEYNADVILMQETYSHGDFIAAELGYYFATTVDWDYLNQGANISVLSRYPIREVYVPAGAPFMNVSCKVAISETQDMYVMSNWYGMQKFPEVFSFHEERFKESDSIPVLFGGDFNAVPHTDGGQSPASVKMLSSGFTDGYRSTYPDVTKYPGYSHESQRRIDQLYYKGKGLKNTSTQLIDTWPAGYPSDHYMILSTFRLDYRTK